MTHARPLFQRRRGALRLAGLPLLLTGLTGACARSAPEPIEVRVQVSNGAQTPIAGAQLRVRGDYLGTTSTLGEATLRVPGQPGDRVPLSLTCPSGSTPPAGESALVLPDPALTQPTPVELVCEPQQREAVVVVHTGGEALSLPIKLDGVVVGQTDALGFAHVHVRAAPESSFEISLDTASTPRLSPANPAQRFRLTASDEVFVFEPAFDAGRARKGKRAAPPPKRRARRVP